MNNDPCIKIEDAMTEEQRQAFIDHFCQRNPHWRGAHVADMLQMMDDADAYLDVLEPFWEEHRDKIPAFQARFYSTAILALQEAGEAVTWQSVKALAEKARGLPTTV